MKTKMTMAALVIVLASCSTEKNADSSQFAAAHRESFPCEYLDCSIKGQSDSSVFSVPADVHLNCDGDCSLYEGKKEVKATFSSVSHGIKATYTKIVDGNILKYTYVFDDDRLDSDGIGSATLSVETIGAQGSASGSGPQSSATIYSCTGAVD